MDEIVAPNLDYIPTQGVDALRAFHPTINRDYVKLTREAKLRGKDLGIKVHIYPLQPRDDVLMCDADPLHRVWISVSGEIAPCPYVALSLCGQIPRIFWGKKQDHARVSFGNVSGGLERVFHGQEAL